MFELDTDSQEEKEKLLLQACLQEVHPNGEICVWTMKNRSQGLSGLAP